MSFNPLEILKMNFRFLEEDFNFKEIFEEFSPEVMGDAIIVYESATITLSIVNDRSQVFITIGSPTWPENDWFSFTDVIHFFNPKIVDVYIYFDDVIDNEERINLQAKRLAQLLRENCKPILNGDLSMAKEIREIEKDRVTKLLDHLKSLSPVKKSKDH